jgi:hypothetical protein
LKTQAVRCMSVSNLNEKRLKHTDEEVIQMRNKFLILTRNRAIFKQLERNQKWTLAIICIVYFVCFCTISMLSTFFYEVVFYIFYEFFLLLTLIIIHLWIQLAILHNISTSTYGTKIITMLHNTFCCHLMG